MKKELTLEEMYLISGAKLWPKIIEDFIKNHGKEKAREMCGNLFRTLVCREHAAVLATSWGD